MQHRSLLWSLPLIVLGLHALPACSVEAEVGGFEEDPSSSSGESPNQPSSSSGESPNQPSSSSGESPNQPSSSSGESPVRAPELKFAHGNDYVGCSEIGTLNDGRIALGGAPSYGARRARAAVWNAQGDEMEWTFGEQPFNGSPDDVSHFALNGLGTGFVAFSMLSAQSAQVPVEGQVGPNLSTLPPPEVLNTEGSVACTRAAASGAVYGINLPGAGESGYGRAFYLLGDAASTVGDLPIFHLELSAHDPGSLYVLGARTDGAVAVIKRSLSSVDSAFEPIVLATDAQFKVGRNVLWTLNGQQIAAYSRHTGALTWYGSYTLQTGTHPGPSFNALAVDDQDRLYVAQGPVLANAVLRYTPEQGLDATFKAELTPSGAPPDGLGDQVVMQAVGDKLLVSHCAADQITYRFAQ